MLIKSKITLAVMGNIIDAIQCALDGKPHPLILTDEQRRLRLIAHRTAFYPRQPVVKNQQPAKENTMGYGESRYMGD